MAVLLAITNIHPSSCLSETRFKSIYTDIWNPYRSRISISEPYYKDDLNISFKGIYTYLNLPILLLKASFEKMLVVFMIKVQKDTSIYLKYLSVQEQYPARISLPKVILWRNHPKRLGPGAPIIVAKQLWPKLALTGSSSSEASIKAMLFGWWGLFAKNATKGWSLFSDFI